MIDETGQITEVYGRKIRNDLRPGTPLHLYLPGPHRGVWNVEGVAGSKGEVILAEALIDAMTFRAAGYRNVTATYGAGGFTDDHLAAFARYGVERVLIAFDRDDAGDTGAAAVAQRLMEAGIAAFRIVFPKGLDANAYARQVTPAAKSLGVLIRKAQWLGNGKAPALTSAADPLALAVASAEPAPLAVSAAEPAPTPSPEPPIPEPAAMAIPLGPVPDPLEAQSDQEIVMLLEDRRYRVRG